jgi:hypothetical protein
MQESFPMLLIPVKSSIFTAKLSVYYRKQNKMKYPFLILLFFSTGIAHAQQNNNWYFGTNAAITFNQNTGQTVPAAIHNSVMVANEAAANISDKKGKLLFNTNGVDIYNQRHELIQNGNNIGGHLLACQVLIVHQDSGAYVWVVKALDKNTGKQHNRKGAFIIIR